jgi:hypothetical protein
MIMQAPVVVDVTFAGIVEGLASDCGSREGLSLAIASSSPPPKPFAPQPTYLDIPKQAGSRQANSFLLLLIINLRTRTSILFLFYY